MARCTTCHRRLAAGKACPLHGGPVAEPSRTVDVTPPLDFPEPIGARLGAGGFASVWELASGRVLKLAHASHDLARARMAREGDALAAIGGALDAAVAAPVPRLHASGVSVDGRAWLVMDRITGATLDALLAAGPSSLPEIVGIASATLGALERVHAAGFVHRDLKPDNLARTSQGSLVILDLGLARRIPEDPDDPTRANVQVGSLEYMPPEQLVDSASVDERSDLYAFGCVLYELCTGRPPFLGDAAALERAHAALRPPPLGALATVPAALEALCHDLLQKDRARRPATAAAARARLREVMRGAGELATPSPRSISMITEGKQPVVLVFAELPKVDRALLGLFAARRLVVVSQRGRKVLAAVLGGDHADPAGTGLAVARELVAAGARVGLHLEALRVATSTAGTATLHGEAAERPETWLPAQPWQGIVLSRALASVVQVATRDSDAGAEFRALADEQEHTPLVGRDALLTDLAADAAAAFARGPAFAVLTGDAGVGKTVFAAELARRVEELGARVVHVHVPAPGGGKPSHAALAALVGALPAGVPVVRAVGDALRAAARERPTAVILDDLHHADHDLLDALEYATLGGEALPLWTLGVASPRLSARRPQLGARAERHRKDSLAPLDEDAAVALAAALLKPAEYPPLRALRRLAAIAHGNPLHLTMLARELHEKGGVRERPGGAPFLDTTAIDALEPAALGPWLAARELAPLAPELVALARVCAVIGGDIGKAELAAIVDAVERGGGATTTIDADVGLAELGRAGLLAADERGHRFASALVEEGIYATTNEAERVAIHEAALAFWRARADDPDSAEHVARHAEATGARAIAAAAFATLGTRAQLEHRVLDADQAWTGAVRTLSEMVSDTISAGSEMVSDTISELRGRALLGRARARYGLQRVVEALADLDEAAACATAIGDRGLEIDALLERSTVLDWAEDFAGSADAAARARALLAAAPSDTRALELAVAEGRAAFRAADQGAAKHADAVTLLRAARARAQELGRADLAAIAGLMLGPTLAWLHDPSAEPLFAELVDECSRAGDRLHLGAAYANRAWLWGERGEVERTASDLRNVIQIARELGQAILERIGTHNLAEELLWQGHLDEALPLARRCLAIQRAHGEGSTIPDRMLLGRILTARGDRAELAELVAGLATGELGAEDAGIVAFMHAAASDREWPEALARASDLPVAIRLELMWVAIRRGVVDAAARTALAQLATEHPIWKRRAHEL